MFAIVGILLVFGAVIGGFLMEKGHIAVLVQPAEFLIIVGAGLGTLLIANPLHTLKAIFSSALGVFGKSHFTRERYVSTLKMMYELLNKVRRTGMLSIEADIEQPAESLIFREYPAFLHDEAACSFVCDTMRMAVTGGIEPFDLDQMMDLDMEVQHRSSHQPVAALTTVADSLPGLGIVAAVLGVVITMGALGGPPEEIGHKVAAALVGTFLGILLCYGLVGPIGSYLSKEAEEEHAFLYVLRVLMVSFIKGNAPVQAVEMARRAIPMHVRPTFVEVEAACRGQQADGAARAEEQAA
jgi:chemotaxis protein MotA